MKKTKVYIALLLVITLALGQINISFAEERNIIDFDIKAKKNVNIMEEMLTELGKSKNTTVLQKTGSEDSISFNIKNNKKLQADNSGNELVLKGEMIYNDIKHKFEAKGDFYLGNTENGNIGVYGVATGYLDNQTDQNNHLTLTVQFDPQTSKTYVFASIGMIDENTTPNFVIYGEPVEEITPIIKKLSKERNAKSFESNQIYDNDITVQNQQSFFAAASSSDYNTNFISTQGSYGTAQGSIYQLSALTVFAPKRMKANSSYKLFTKMNTSSTNAYNFARQYFVLYGTTSVWTDRVFIHMGSAGDNKLEVSNLDPAAKNSLFPINVNIPFDKFGIFSLAALTINAPHIVTSLSRYAGSIVDNTAQWSFYKFPSKMDWENNNPAATEGGVSGCATMIYYQNRAYDYTLNTIGSGEITYSFQDVYGAQIRSGSFTTINPGITHSITVDAN